MEIKKNLKALDIKISKLATELGVSRPTLDAYIEYYESGQSIPNEGYQKIFEYLFSGEEINSIEFAQKYDYVKRIMLADAKAGAENAIHDERENKILNNIREVLATGTVDEHLIEFINLFINNRDNELVKAIYMYFNYSNGFADLSKQEIEQKEKAIYSQLAKLFSNYKDNSIELLEEFYNQLQSKNQELIEAKTIKVRDSEIVDYIKTKLNESEELDIEELKLLIASREVK
jgi:hypothetical protein